MAQELNRPINRVRNGLRIDGRLETPEDTQVTVILKDENGNILLASGATVPTDDEKGFAKGCIFIDTSGGVATTFYVNEGDEDDCDFNVSAGGAATSFTALTDTPNSYAASGNFLVKITDGADKLEFVEVGGDLTMNAAGEFFIANEAVDDDKIASDAAIAWSKMAVSDDIDPDGTVTGLSITGSAGNVLRLVGGVWTAVDPTTLPGGTASGLAQSVAIEGGTYDLTLKTTAQTSSAADLTIPDLAGANQEIVLTGATQELDNKTLNSPTLVTPALGVASATSLNKVTITEPASGSTLTIADAKTLTVNDDVTIDTDAITFAGTEVLTLAATKDVTFADEFATSGAFKITLTATGATSITLPTSGTIVARDSVDILENKSIAAEDNTITGLNADELAESAATTAAIGVPFIIPVVNTGAGTLSIFNANAPYKIRILWAHAVATKACNGNWKLDNGTNDITANVAYGLDKAVSVVSSIDDDYHEIAEDGSLRLVNSDPTDTAIVYIQAMRVS